MDESRRGLVEAVQLAASLSEQEAGTIRLEPDGSVTVRVDKPRHLTDQLGEAAQLLRTAPGVSTQHQHELAFAATWARCVAGTLATTGRVTLVAR